MPVYARSEGVRHAPVSNASVRRAAEAMLKALALPKAELSILLCSDERIHELNRDFRGKDKPTDVLAFAMNEGESSPHQAHVLGDVVISLPTARRQAGQRGHAIKREVQILLAHGLLHLLGYDHQTPQDYRVMMARQEILVTAPSGCGQP